MKHLTLIRNWLPYLLFLAGLAACAWVIQKINASSRKVGGGPGGLPIARAPSLAVKAGDCQECIRDWLPTNDGDRADSYTGKAKDSPSEIANRPSDTFLIGSVVQKETPSEMASMGGSGKHSIDCVHKQYTKSVSQSSRRHGLGVSQNTVVRTNQTLGESRGCLPGGDEPRNMDKPDTPHKRGHETVSSYPATKFQAMCEASQPGGVSV